MNFVSLHTSRYLPQAPWFQKSYVFRAGAILIQQILGWPLYLFFNISGHYYER